MNIRHWLSRKNTGFSLLELLVASGIASTVLLVAFGTVGQFYFSQKKVNLSQDFAAESRFLMERIVQTVRDNTIDYDQYFLDVGPDGCSRSIDPTNYESTFYWDTNGDGELDRNLGGVDTNGTIDPCAQAFHGDLTTLYLINSAQTVQTAFQQNGDAFELRVFLGADTDAIPDGKADTWGVPDANCEISGHLVMGAKNLSGSAQEEFCARAHAWTQISPKGVNVLNFSFLATPDRDPYLNFRNDAAQVHPHVLLSLETELANGEQYGLEPAEVPTMLLQTTASSRVFGDIRQ